MRVPSVDGKRTSSGRPADITRLYQSGLATARALRWRDSAATDGVYKGVDHGRSAQQQAESASRNARASRRRVLGAGTTAGAFLAFGMTPLATSPAAHADEFDVIIDPIINSILGSITSLDALAGIDPSSALDLGSLALPATDAALASEPLAAAASSADAVTAAARPPIQLLLICFKRTSMNRFTRPTRPGSIARPVRRSTTQSIRISRQATFVA